MPSPVTTVEPSSGEASHRFPQFLPDGTHFLFYIRGTGDARGVYLGSLDGKTKKRLLVSDWAAAYARAEPGSDGPGYLFFVREGTLLAHSFNATRMELAGEAFPVAQPVTGSTASYAAFGVSDGGALAYWSGVISTGQLTWFDRRGTPLGTVGSIEDYVNFNLSPDERELAVAPVNPRSNTGDIWILDLVRGVSTPVTSNPHNDASPIWSPDGKRLLFRSDREGFLHLYQTASGGGGKEELLFKADNNKLPSDWSADGRVILFHTSPASSTGWDLWSLRVDDLVAKAFLETPFNEYQGRLSSDGRFIAYTSDESGQLEVYVRPFPEGAAKWRISAGGGSEPAWRRDGKELFYLAADGKLMSVGVRTGTAPFEAPRPLFQSRLPGPRDVYRTSYVVSGDGQRFLVNTVVGEVKSTPITVVLNWARELGKQ